MRRRKASDRERIGGILLLDKERGPSSGEMVRRVSRVVGRRIKVGHAGTLDPSARGLLIILIGEATKISDVCMEGEKRYRAVIRFGETTDTGDSDGKVISSADASGLTMEAIGSRLASYVGEIEQRPPLYSAVKVGGKRAYVLARKGEKVELPPRKVRIHEITVEDYSPPDLTVFVRCGKGTYLRSLAADLGGDLSTGGHIHDLTRLGIGPFGIEEARRMDVVTRENWRDLLLPEGSAFAGLPRFVVTGKGAAAMRRGEPVRAGDYLVRPKGPVGGRCGVFSEETDRLVAFGRIGAGSTLTERRILYPA